MVPTCFAHDFSIRIISRKMIAISLFFVRSVAQSLLPGNWWCRSYQKLVMSQDLHIGLQEIMPWMKKHSGTMTMRYPGFTSLLSDVYPPVYMASWVLTYTVYPYGKHPLVQRRPKFGLPLSNRTSRAFKCREPFFNCSTRRSRPPRREAAVV